MATKIVLRLNGFTTAAPPQSSIGYTGAAHAFGTSESVWVSLVSDNAVKNYIRLTLGPARAGCLPSNVTLTDALMYTSAGGRGVPVPLGFVGTQPRSDQVNVAALMATRNPTAPAQRRWWLHCLPDIWVVDGELVVNAVQTGYIRNYLNAMQVGNWLGLVRNDLQSIVTISQAGLVSLAGASPYAVGQLLRVSRTLDANKRKRGAQKFVASVGPLANQFTLGDWTLGTCTGGSIFRPTYDFYSIGGGDGAYVERVGTKRVGRPFDLYRGRQPATHP